MLYEFRVRDVCRYAAAMPFACHTPSFAIDYAITCRARFFAFFRFYYAAYYADAYDMMRTLPCYAASRHGAAGLLLATLLLPMPRHDMPR